MEMVVAKKVALLRLQSERRRQREFEGEFGIVVSNKKKGFFRRFF